MTVSDRTKPFDPTRHLRVLDGRGGATYLDVRWRIHWLRVEHPDALIETTLIRHDPEYAVPDADGQVKERGLAICRAFVAIPDGGSATGYAAETAAGFRDYLEKAETAALGRALAHLGYGTASLAPERDNRSVDAPVEPRPARPRRAPRTVLEPPPARPGREGQPEHKPGLQPATERQVRFIHAVAREAGMDESELDTWSTELYGQGVGALNRRDASTLIEALQRRRNERGATAAVS